MKTLILALLLSTFHIPRVSAKTPLKSEFECYHALEGKMFYFTSPSGFFTEDEAIELSILPNGAVIVPNVVRQGRLGIYVFDNRRVSFIADLRPRQEESEWEGHLVELRIPGRPANFLTWQKRHDQSKEVYRTKEGISYYRNWLRPFSKSFDSRWKSSRNSIEFYADRGSAEKPYPRMRLGRSYLLIGRGDALDAASVKAIHHDLRMYVDRTVRGYEKELDDYQSLKEYYSRYNGSAPKGTRELVLPNRAAYEHALRACGKVNDPAIRTSVKKQLALLETLAQP